MEDNSPMRDVIIDGVRRRLHVLRTFREDKRPLSIQEFQSTAAVRLTSLLSEGGVVCLMGPSGAGKTHVLEYAIQELQAPPHNKKIYRIILPTIGTQDPSALMNFMAEEVYKILNPASNVDFLDEILADPDFIRKKREYNLKSLQREVKGAIPLPADFKVKINWHDQIVDATNNDDDMQVDDDRREGTTSSRQKQPGVVKGYVNQVDEIRNMLDRLLVQDGALSTHLIVEMDQFDLLAHKTKRQTFLYSFLEFLAVAPSQISVVLQTQRADAFTLLEKRLASRLPQRQIIIEPPHKLESLISLYQYWLFFSADDITDQPWLRDWNDSVEALLKAPVVTQELSRQLSSFNSIFYYQNHTDLLLYKLSLDTSAVPSLSPKDFGAPFDEYLSPESTFHVGQSLSRVEFIVLVASRNLELNMKDQDQTYSFDDLFAEYETILQMAESGLVESMRQVLRRYRVPRQTVLRAFESLLDTKFFQYRGTGRSIGATATLHLSVQYRPVRSTLTLDQLEQIIRSRRNEFDFLKSMKF